jgi:hypothetical protein
MGHTNKKEDNNWVLQNAEKLFLLILIILASVFLGWTFYEYLHDTREFRELEYDYDNPVVDYLWVNHSKIIDANFINLCYEFKIQREFIENKYDCKNYSADFKTLMNLHGYPVNEFTFYNYNKTKGHRLNIIPDHHNEIIYVESQTCVMYGSLEELRKQLYGVNNTNENKTNI